MAGDQEMRDLLIRLDQKVGDGFQNIDKKLDNMERRADNHENRIRSLENDNQSRLGYVSRFEAVEGQVKQHEGRFQQLEGARTGMTLSWKIAVAAGAIAMFLVGVLGAQVVFTKPKPPVATTQTTTSIPVIPAS
jgi:hypothetical protein